MANLQTSFLDFAPSELMRAEIEKRIGESVHHLEAKFGPILSCRILIKGPSAHHRLAPFQVHLHLVLPHDRDVHANRTPDEDERQIDLHFALSDAFERAERQLLDEASRLQHAAKAQVGRRSSDMA